MKKNNLMNKNNHINKNFSITVVIPTKNRHPDLLNFFDSLLKQSVLPDQIIVIDQSDENLSEASVRFKLGINKSSMLTYIYNTKIRGLVEAKSYSIQYNKSDLICFLEDDEILEHDFLEHIVAGFTLNPEMNGCCGVITNPPNKNFIYELFFHLFHTGLYKDIRIGIFGYKNLKHQFFVSDKLSGGLSAWRKEVFSHTFFDVGNNLHFTEDIDFSSRVALSFPNSLFINTNAKLAHYFSKSNRFNHKDIYSNKVIENIIYYKKRKQVSFALFHLIWLLLGILLQSSLKTITLFSLNPICGYFFGLYKGARFKVLN